MAWNIEQCCIVEKNILSTDSHGELELCQNSSLQPPVICRGIGGNNVPRKKGRLVCEHMLEMGQVMALKSIIQEV